MVKRLNKKIKIQEHKITQSRVTQDENLGTQNNKHPWIKKYMDGKYLDKKEIDDIDGMMSQMSFSNDLSIVFFPLEK